MYETYKSVNENPCNMCMPLGGIIAFKGIEKSMVLLHGSQGCATYMRRHIAEHYHEPIDVASSSLNEKGTVYGGEKNLIKALDNVVKVYNPDCIGILTTCLAETIGEDIDRIKSEYKASRNISIPIITAPTPGYGGTHSEGFVKTSYRIVEELSTNKERHDRINVIVPNISTADLREIKRLLELMKIPYILFPDYSDTLDSPFNFPYKKIPDGGTKISDVMSMGGSIATIEIGVNYEETPGKYLQDRFNVPLYKVPIPIGLRNTDVFLKLLKEITGNPIPKSIEMERSRLLDGMIDSHKYNFEGRCIIFGDPEMVYSVFTTCMENGIHPLLIATGSKAQRLKELVISEDNPLNVDITIIDETDFSHILKLSEEKEVNIAIGPSDGKYLTEKGGIPLVRLGFPILDRVGGQRILSVGYTGTLNFLDRITNTLLENKYKTYRKDMYEKYYKAM
ncbi:MULTISPECIES: nitrogenase component 1 [Thermoanaerobacterium]|uniref:Oxidoreductase/nitrogenase component 1 n=2 Tax=Thermoanaerobacterium TaxID=28895 RepID=W9E8F0_9THEO|nr:MULTISPECIES: nitrogenase component 1 [Thermoanaerobacterium]AFK87237.1 oxidoreductase/nitrogenase component 1 [Thermoanaerobacterium saccharolyticum JW/SL-YS485]ETO38057.1 oxidoreductase/nitrogenase component 1 [Thermoanaerobacterium aotearoense SCUT27]